MCGGVGVDAVDHRRLVIVLVLQPEVDGVGYEDEECNCNFSIENHRKYTEANKNNILSNQNVPNTNLLKT